MAILVNENTDYLVRSASVPVFNAVTITAWVKINGAGGTAPDLFSLVDSAETSYAAMKYSAGNLGVYANTSGTTVIATPADGVWHFVAMTQAGAGAGQLIGYAGLIGNALTAASRAGVSFTAAKLYLGYPNTDFFNGIIGPVKVWDAVLTAAEIEQERNQYLPARTANLHIFSPFLEKDGTNFIDFSGAGKNWTEGGTVTYEDGPPIPWKTGRQRFIRRSPVAANTTTLQTWTAIAPDVTYSTGGKCFLSLFNGAGSSVVLKIFRIWMFNSKIDAAITGVVPLMVLSRISTDTSGGSPTTITPVKYDTSNNTPAATLNANVTCRTGNTSTGTVDADLRRFYISTDELIIGATTTAATSPILHAAPNTGSLIWDTGYDTTKVQPITLRVGYGIQLWCAGIASATGQATIQFEFTQE